MSFSTRTNIDRPSRWPLLRRKAGLTAGALLLAGSIAGWTAADAVGTSAAAVTAPPAAATPAGADLRTIGAGVDSYASIVDRIAPAVVTIRSEKRIQTVRQDMPDDPLFRRFFG